MTYLELVFWLAFIGVVAWALTKHVPMPKGIQTLIIVVAVALGIVISLHAFGIAPSLKSGPVIPQIK